MLLKDKDLEEGEMKPCNFYKSTILWNFNIKLLARVLKMYEFQI